MQELFDEMIPFETDFLHNLITILDDKDLKEHN